MNMKEILKYAALFRIVNTDNYIIKKSLEREINEDKVIRIISKEVTDLITKLFISKNDNNMNIKRG